MPVKANIVSQLENQSGLGRQGGAASKGSVPNIMKGTGSGFAAMENTLLKGVAPDPKSLAGGGSGRQFYTKASGGDAVGIKPIGAMKLRKPKV